MSTQQNAMVRMFVAFGLVVIADSKGDMLLNDTFDRETLNPPTYSLGNHQWVVDAGTGISTSGNKLNLNDAAIATVHIDLAPSAVTETITFGLSKAPADTNWPDFVLSVLDTVAGQSVQVRMSASNINYAGISGFAGGINNQTVTSWGSAGASLSTASTAFMPIRLTFTPTSHSLTLNYDGVDVLSFTPANLSQINRMSMTANNAYGGYYQWAVDDLTVSNIPEPAAISLGALAGLLGMSAHGARKRK